MNINVLCRVLAVAAACLWAGQTIAQTNDSKSDLTFAQKSGQVGMAEVQLGKMAQEKGASPAVKRFGERMVMDHTRLNRELIGIARREGIALPQNLDSKHQEEMEQLRKANGMEFDRLYAKEMVTGHEKTIELFENEAHNGQDPALKALAEKAIPILKEHLRLAKETAREVSAEVK